MSFPTYGFGPPFRSTGTSLDVPLPLGFLRGDRLFVLAAWEDSTTTGSASGWTTSLGDAMSTDRWALFTRPSDGTEGATMNVALTASEGFHAMSLWVRGRAFTASSLSSGGSGTQPDPPSLNADYTDDILWLAGYACSATGHVRGNAGLPPTNCNTWTGVDSSIGASLAWAVRPLRAASFNPGEFTCNDSTHGWDAFTLAVYPSERFVGNRRARTLLDSRR